MIENKDIEEMNKLIDEGKWDIDYDMGQIFIKSQNMDLTILYRDVNENDIWNCLIRRNDGVTLAEEFCVSGFSDVEDIIVRDNKWWYLGYIMFYSPPEQCM